MTSSPSSQSRSTCLRTRQLRARVFHAASVIFSAPAWPYFQLGPSHRHFRRGEFRARARMKASVKGKMSSGPGLSDLLPVKLTRSARKASRQRFSNEHLSASSRSVAGAEMSKLQPRNVNSGQPRMSPSTSASDGASFAPGICMSRWRSIGQWLPRSLTSFLTDAVIESASRSRLTRFGHPRVSLAKPRSVSALGQAPEVSNSRRWEQCLASAAALLSVSAQHLARGAAWSK